MIYVMTIRNKSGLTVNYKKSPMMKLVFEFATPDGDVAMDAVRDVLQDVNTSDPYLASAIEEIKDDTRDSGFKDAYNFNLHGLQVDWKVIV